jgi:RND family efflux transporter MFP subunit
MKTNQLLVVLLGFAGCSREKPADEAPIPVQVESVRTEVKSRDARYSGSVEPKRRVELAFRVGGYVRTLAEVTDANGRRSLQEGDRVTKGTVLATLREADYQAQLGVAVAALGEANASVRQAGLDADRSAKLLASRSIAKAEADNMETRREAAIARAKGAEARVREARLALADSTLVAPIDGVILKRSVEVGTLVMPGSPAFVIADTSDLKVVFAAPEAMVGRLSTGGSVSVELAALDTTLEAKITRIAPSADRASRTFEVEATLDNSHERLKTGMVASLSLDGGSSTALLALPLTAIVRSPSDRRGFAVFVADGEDRAVARIRDVVLGDIVGNAVQVNES